MDGRKFVNFKIIATSDVHGCFFPYDMIEQKEMLGSLARVSSFVKEQRQNPDQHVILLDAGDVLQGQPTTYYSNFVETDSSLLAADIMNTLHYDAVAMGNHDIETGHRVYDEWMKQLQCPVLAANLICRKTEKPYVAPYKIITKEGVRIAVLGLLTTAIPYWLNEHLWEGLYFENMVEAARKWIDILLQQEHVDLIVGLFHSGWSGGIQTPGFEENQTKRIAEEVPGFDLIIFGHDHILRQEEVVCCTASGKTVLCMNPSSQALNISSIDVHLEFNKDQHVISRQVVGEQVDISNYPIDLDFMQQFHTSFETIRNFVSQPIGVLDHSIFTRDCYFGNAPFIDYIHDIQLQLTGADISFAAPLTYDTSLKAGELHVYDLFRLYQYENWVNVLLLTGKEIKNFLELSYDRWIQTMHSSSDEIMRIETYSYHGKLYYFFKNIAFNFDTAAGIDYEVDVTQTMGNRVRIIRMSNGNAFHLHQVYRVVMHSYRAHGGGELLTKGAGISFSELPARIIYQSPHTQRYYLQKALMKAKHITISAHSNWKFVPDEWVKPALKKAYFKLFH
jgi:2',3'-cyclic-nucleotide 2'-phosphodiesterase/3'-nucleotidase